MGIETHPASDWLQTFDAIRSYSDHEVSKALSSLASDPHIIESLFAHLPSAPASDVIVSELKKIGSIDAFQGWLRQTLNPLLESSVTEFSSSGLEQLTRDNSHIFISNHHDIIMDPLVINLALLESGFDSAHCAIGDNLLFSNSATTLAKLNKCFRVIRSLSSPKAMLRAMRVQSAYIQHLHFQQHSNIWIAQKEGRSKDNIDLTNPALIKMLCLAKPKEVNPNDYLATLNIVPVSISYEWDPCDIEKAQQLENEASPGGYTKKSHEDLEAIKTGLLGFKGKVHVAFGSIIRALDHTPLNRYETANQIDAFIHQNYRCYPSNLAATRLLGQTLPEQEEAGSEVSILDAEKELETRLEQSPEAVKIRVLKAYAQPVQAKYKQ
ncbi:MAG: acyltransferase [Oleiphilus sp.]|nr:MAG: acyltransferase [Oleiphilus sp.]